MIDHRIDSVFDELAQFPEGKPVRFIKVYTPNLPQH